MGGSARLTVLADAGAIYAIVDSGDRWHESVANWWQANSDEVLIPDSALPEICYFLQKRLGARAETDFIRSMVNGEFETIPVQNADFDRILAIMEEYQDLGLGYVDASIVATAERLNVRNILTTDRRHFSAVRPKHARSLTLLPGRLPNG